MNYKDIGKLKNGVITKFVPVGLLFLVLPLFVVHAQQKRTKNLSSQISAPHIDMTNREILQSWLASKPGWRPATKDDALIGLTKEGLSFVKSEIESLNHHPYYAASDFNSDGNRDFAVVLIRKVGRTHKYALAVFNGPFKKKALPTFYTERLEGGDWLFWMTDNEFGNRFIVGPPASDAGYVVKPRGNKYVVE